MISRIADHCFWLGRYLERAESTARVLHVTRNLALDADLSGEQCWLPVIIVAGERAPFLEKHGPDAASDGEIVQLYMTFGDDAMTCIFRSVSAARDNAKSIREVVSLEVWETLNELYLWLGSAEARAEYADHRHGFYRRIRQSVQLCLGLLRSTMLHDTPLDFIWFGVLLERAGQTARVLDVHHHALTAHPEHQEVETSIWLSLLRACSGFEPFMKRNQGKVSALGVAEFLIGEPAFPRSIRYCVSSAYQRLCAIRPPEATHLPGGETLARLGALDAWLRREQPGWLAPAAIHDVLTHVVDEIAATGEGLARELFGYGSPTSVAPPPPEAAPEG